MKPWGDAPAEQLSGVLGVLTDIDDTLTTGGAITPDALAALAQLKSAGFQVLPITGRPVGWSVPFVRSWPVNGILAENGSVLLTPDGSGVHKRYQESSTARAAHFEKLQAVAAIIQREVPHAKKAQDSAGRETDIAIDHSEFAHLSAEGVSQVVRIAQREGLNATVSSIHINCWLGAHNKRQGAAWAARELFGRDLEAERERWVYVGDSANDQLMFEAFPLSVGVANIAPLAASLTHRPRYITAAPRGAGFAQVVQRLCGSK